MKLSWNSANVIHNQLENMNEELQRSNSSYYGSEYPRMTRLADGSWIIVYTYLLFGSNDISLIIGSQLVGRMSHRVSEHAFLLFGLGLACLKSVTVLIVAIIHGPLFALVIPLFFS